MHIVKLSCVDLEMNFSVNPPAARVERVSVCNQSCMGSRLHPSAGTSKPLKKQVWGALGGCVGCSQIINGTLQPGAKEIPSEHSAASHKG